MSSEQFSLCNVYFFVHALPKGRCLTQHCVVCLLCCGLCVSLLVDRAYVITIWLHIYFYAYTGMYTYIFAARQIVLLLL